MKHKLFSRFIGVLLAVVMLASLVSMPSLATDDVQEADQAATSGQVLSQDETSEDVSDLTEEDGTVTDSVTDDNAEVTENQTAVPDSAEEKEISTDSTEENEEVASEPVEITESNAESGADIEDAEKTCDVQAFYDALMAVQTADEAEALFTSYTTEQLQAMLSSFSEEQVTAVKAHLQDVAATEVQDDAEPIESKVFTDAGPLMPPVDVSSAKMANSMLNSIALYGADVEEPSEDDLVYSKKLEDWNPETGTGKIVIEAYAKGQYTITEETKASPVDIVLVLDQSGSMDYNFDGKSTNNNAEKRQAALKTAVTNFIDNVKDKYTSTADHRMAIVTFDSNAEVLSGWTSVDESGAGVLGNKIKELPNIPSGATNVGAGMTEARELLNNSYYTGANTKRQQVVIVFTDGVPTTQSDFDVGVANTAISAAKQIKDSGATIYTVGIFNGVDKDQLHGDAFKYVLIHDDVPCDGTVGSIWGGSWLETVVNYNDFSLNDIAAGNRFLNYLSSNFKVADNVGLEKGRYDPGDTWGVGAGEGYKITQNFVRDSNEYYLTANDEESLMDAFTEIVEEVGSGSTEVTLNANSVVRDVLTDYFVVDNSSDGVKAYTIRSTNGTDFESTGTEVPADTIDVTERNGKTVIDVTGFDFSDRYVATTGRAGAGLDGEGNYYGEKLRIEIPIKVDYTKTLGGNNIPTNETTSGIYMTSQSAEPEVTFDSCTANVDINYDFATTDSTVYVTQSANLENRFASNVIYNESSVPVDGETNKYVTITYTVKNGETVVGTYVISAGGTSGRWTSGSGTVENMTNCTEYTVTCEVTPSETVEAGQVSATTYTDSKSVQIHVLKPEIKWRDSTEDYKTLLTAEMLQDHMVGEVEWKDVTHTDIPTAGDVPALTYDFVMSPVPAENDQDGTPLLTAETVVSVTVKMGSNTNITEYTTFRWQKDSECPDSCTEAPGNGQFRIHLGTGNLTITKTVTGNIPNNLKNTVFRFQVVGTKGITTKVVIKCPNAGGTASVTLKNLPADTYTVTELTSPRFELTSPNNVQVGINETAAFTNEYNGEDWKGDSSSLPNTFTYKADGDNSGWYYQQETGTN